MFAKPLKVILLTRVNFVFPDAVLFITVHAQLITEISINFSKETR